MTINFPNQSRSYDSRHRCIRFWGHDDALEVSFVVEEDALTQIDLRHRKMELDALRSRLTSREDLVVFNEKNLAYKRLQGALPRP